MYSGPLAVLMVAAFIECSAGRGAAEEINRANKLDRATMIYKPYIDYPYEARRARITGTGIVVVELDPKGRVRNAYMAPSTGARILDDAALDAFRQARFKPGTHTPIKIPITFTVGGRAGRVLTELRVTKKPMDDALAHFLGKGTVVKGPIPGYPRFPPWTFKQGKGLYELHVGDDGKVADVRMLKSSGDNTFDRIIVGALGKWRLRRGPLIVVLPLSFSLTPTKFSVEIPKTP